MSTLNKNTTSTSTLPAAEETKIDLGKLQHEDKTPFTQNDLCTSEVDAEIITNPTTSEEIIKADSGMINDANTELIVNMTRDDATKEGNEDDPAKEENTTEEDKAKEGTVTKEDRVKEGNATKEDPLKGDTTKENPAKEGDAIKEDPAKEENVTIRRGRQTSEEGCT